ncbi:unnamed protein product, partial [Rotaria sp. Silwood1]
NSLHLKPAVLIDSILIQFTRDASEGKLLSKEQWINAACSKLRDRLQFLNNLI